MGSLEFTWFELYPPRGCDLDVATRIVRTLASRPRSWLTHQTPPVVFELRSGAGRVRWLLCIPRSLTATLLPQLRAQVPGVTVVQLQQVHREVPALAVEVRTTNTSKPLRLDLAADVSAVLLEALRALGAGQAAVLQWVVGPAQRRATAPRTFNVAQAIGLKPATKTTAADSRLWRQKSAEPLFAVQGRIGATAETTEMASAIISMMAGALALASTSQAAIITTRPSASQARALQHLRRRHLRWPNLLNAAELAALNGWPLDGVAEHLDVVGTTGRAPKALILQEKSQKASPRERVLGRSTHPADGEQLVTMPVASAVHHVHVTGVTGSGKSTQLANFVRADMAAGRSVLVIEPRGDLITDILAGVPPSRRQDVVLIEPGDARQVVGINPLAGQREDAERRADHLAHLFHELYGTSLGARSADILLHSLIALARSQGGTLADLPVLLTNGAFRRQVLTQVNDPLVLGPFFAWFNGLSDAERAQVIAPLLNKTRAFLSRSPVRRLLGQASPRFQLDELFTARRIVLVNLNTGVIGTETASLIGAILVTQLWQAIQRRAVVPPSKRHPVMVVIDEVQNYLRLPVGIGDMLDQARAMGVSLTLAHQHLGQLPPSLRAAFMANARSRMVFRPSPDDIKPLAAALGSGVTTDHLHQLGPFEALIHLLVEHQMAKPFTVKTLPLGPAVSNIAELSTTSRTTYGVDGTELDAELQRRWQGDLPGGPIGTTRRAA
jgi:DNA helicase HerA-like ATPase